MSACARRQDIKLVLIGIIILAEIRNMAVPFSEPSMTLKALSGTITYAIVDTQLAILHTTVAVAAS
jgi:hypothetical protein